MIRVRPIAVLDACVLYPAPVRDLLLHLASFELYQPKWSSEITDEWMRNLLLKRPDLQEKQLQKTTKEMLKAFPDALVEDYPNVTVEGMPDEGDLHVLSAAIHCGARFIVTFNLKDFPAEVLSKHKIQPIHPDKFCYYLAQEDNEYALLAFRYQVRALKNPPKTEIQVMETLAKCGLVETAAWIRRRYPNPTTSLPE